MNLACPLAPSEALNITDIVSIADNAKETGGISTMRSRYFKDLQVSEVARMAKPSTPAVRDGLINQVEFRPICVIGPRARVLSQAQFYEIRIHGKHSLTSLLSDAMYQYSVTMSI